MSKFKIVLKNGFHFDMEAEEIKVTYSTVTGDATKLKYSGGSENVPIYIDVSEIVAVIQARPGEDGSEKHEINA